MDTNELTRLSDQALLRGLASWVSKERRKTAQLLAHIAEAETRKRWLATSHASMYEYCIEYLHMDEDEAQERIDAARTAREFPELFLAVADGRLEPWGIVRLAPHLTQGNFEELIAAASNKSEPDMKRFLAERFPGDTT